MSSFQDVVLLEPRAVPLGGPRGMTAHRTLPARRISLIGAWCSVDHFGPFAAHTPAALPAPTLPHGRLRSCGRVGHPAP